MHELFNKDIRYAAARLFCIICAVLGAYLFIKYAIGAFAPFMIAAVIAVIMRRPAARLSRITGLSKRICSVILLISFFFAAAAVLFIIFVKLKSEGERLISHLASNGGADIISELLGEGLSIENVKFSFLERMFGADAVEYLQNRADSIIRSIVSNAVSSLAVNIPRWVISFLSSLPRRLVSVTVTVVASFYFCLDYDKIKKAVLGHIPKIISERLPSIKRRVYKTASGYLRAFLFLFILTFCQLYVGFSLFRVSYPFILALTVSFIDILPVLGVGAVLIPWGLLELIVMKDMYTGIGLLVLYVAITVIRQIVEPRVIAVSLGLHPIITLFAMYVGLWLFGFLGMILAPVMIHILFGGLGEGIDKQSDI